MSSNSLSTRNEGILFGTVGAGSNWSGCVSVSEGLKERISDRQNPDVLWGSEYGLHTVEFVVGWVGGRRGYGGVVNSHGIM